MHTNIILYPYFTRQSYNSMYTEYHLIIIVTVSSFKVLGWVDEVSNKPLVTPVIFSIKNRL